MISRFLLCFFALLGFATALSAQPKTGDDGRISFIERIRVADYLTVQKTFPEPYSQSNDLVILQTVDGHPYRSVILKKDAGKYFIQLWSLDDTLPTDPVALDADTARQVMRAFELRLYRFVIMGSGEREAKGRPEAWWLFHRNRDNMASAALVLQDAVHETPEGESFLKNLIGGLVNYVIAPESKRSELTLALDRAATEIIIRDEPK